MHVSKCVCARACWNAGNENILESVIKRCVGIFQFVLTFHVCLILGLSEVLLILILNI